MPDLASVSPASFVSFGELLRYLRKRAELSQRELALHVGYHYSYMSRIENNEYVPDPAVLMSHFVSALNLEKEPAWTRRMLELAASSEEGGANRPASFDPSPDPVAMDQRFLLSLFPISLTPLLGRVQEVAALIKSLARSDIRLINLIGPPGVGKTRLAVQVATEAIDMFAHGLKFIDLAPLTDPNNFLPALAQKLEISEVAELPLITRMAQALRQKNILLVLDNFEQLVEAAPQLYQLLSYTSRVKVLVTSRVPLHIVGENQFAVPPLALPLDSANELVQDLSAYPAIQLFVARARAVQPEFELTSQNTQAVIEICRRLDGLPLAIELAAARVRTFSPQAMLREFEHRFDWLARNNREEQPAKQTLRGAIEWSYNLLSEKEQMLLRRLSVFSGGRTVETAQAVCADSELSADEIFDLLIQLTDKSLLFTESQADETRFNFLETIHEYAREKLKQAGEEVAIRNRHLKYFCQMAERVELEIEYEHQTLWLDRCEMELNNMRAALDWSLREAADLNTGTQLAASLGLFWYLHSHFVEGLERSKVLLQKARELDDEPVLAKLLYRTADLYWHRAEFELAVRLGEEAVALSRKINNKQLLPWALYVLGNIYLIIQDLTAAEKSLTESIAVCAETGYEAVQDIALLLLGIILLRQGELTRAEVAVRDGLTLARRLSDSWSIASGLGTLGEIFLKQKNYEEARINFERSLEAARGVGDKFILGSVLVNLAVLTNLQGQFEESDQYAEEALSTFQAVGDETQQTYPLRIMGYAAVQAGNVARAQVLLRESLIGDINLQNLSGQMGSLIGFAYCLLTDQELQSAVKFCALVESYQREKNIQLQEPDQMALEAVLKQSKKKLGKAKYESTYQQGKSLKLEDTLLQLVKRME